MWFEWEGQVFHLSTTRGRAKYPNLYRDGRIAVLVDDSEGLGQRYVAVYGQAELDDRPEAILQVIRRIRRQYRGVAVAAATTDKELRRDCWALVTMRPQRVLTWVG